MCGGGGGGGKGRECTVQCTCVGGGRSWGGKREGENVLCSVCMYVCVCVCEWYSMYLWDTRVNHLGFIIDHYYAHTSDQWAVQWPRANA